MPKSELRGKVKRPVTLVKEKGPSAQSDLIDSLESEKMSSKQLNPLLENVEEMGPDMTGSAEKTVHQQEDGNPNRKSDEANVELEDSLENAERDAPAAQPVDMSPIDDPLRLYLREMGNVGLLNREGEIRLAKNIEEARQELASAVFGMPMTIISVLISP